MDKWKPMPSRFEKAMKGACYVLGGVMLVWLCVIGGSAFAEFVTSRPEATAEPAKEGKPEAKTDISSPAAKPVEKKAEAEPKVAEKTAVASTTKDESPSVIVKVGTQGADIPYEPEPMVEDDSVVEEAEDVETVEEPDIPEETTETEIVEEIPEPVVQAEEIAEDAVDEEADIPEDLIGEMYSPDDLMVQGEIYQDGQRYTWYSQNVLPGGGLDIPGRHVEDGYVVDEDGYVVIASGELDYGDVVYIPFGSGVGKVYDYCETPETIDVYTDF